MSGKFLTMKIFCDFFRKNFVNSKMRYKFATENKENVLNCK